MILEDLVLEAIEKHHAIQKFGELLWLADEVRQIHPEVIVEIGSDAGGTLWLWSQMFPNAKLFSIDLPDGPFSSGIPHDDSIKAERILADSHNPATRHLLHERLHGRGGLDKDIDFLFIDADHTAEGVEQDFLEYAWMVRPDGIIAFHDIVEHPQNPTVGVHEFWAKVKDPKQGMTASQLITQPTNWGGVGVLYLD